MKIYLTLLVFLISAFFSASLIAQSGTTSMSGTVFDERGQIIFGAAVTLTNAGKGFARTATTNDDGAFNFPAIPPGVYRLEVEMNGFKKFANSEIRASVDSPTEIFAVLEIGNISETVNVLSDTSEALLNTQDATIGSPFNSMQVTQLPTEARDVINLLTLQPGVTRFGYVVGGRSYQANIKLDGIDINEPVAFFRFNHINDAETAAPQFPDTPAPSSWRHPAGFVVGHSWAISKNVFNNFRFGLTRNAFTIFGDSTDNQISFTNVISPRLFRRTVSPVDSVNNLTNNVSLIWRKHTAQFGANVRFFRSRLRTSFRSFDTAAVDSAAYPSGAITTALNNSGYQIANARSVQNAVAAVIGRYTSYTTASIFRRDGVLQPSGIPRQREFRGEEYDFYIQDVWKLTRNLTITAGLRHDLSRPIYETGGYEVKPNIALSEYFERRAASAANGAPYNQPIILDYSGTANGKSPLYKWDKNDFQPRFAVAWSPNFGKTGKIGKTHLGWLFGRNDESVFRGGFTVTNDYLVAALASAYEQQNNLGFASSSQVSNFNLTRNVGEPFTGFNQTIRNLPNPALPVGNLTFPLQPSNQIPPPPIEIGFDENLVSPINYSWNLTYERALPRGLIVSVSYLGRRAWKIRLPRLNSYRPPKIGNTPDDGF